MFRSAEGRRFQIAKRLSTSANQKGSNRVLCEKSEGWQPCFPHMLKHCNGLGDWLVPNEAFVTSRGACSVMTRYQKQSNEANYSHLTQTQIHEHSAS